MTNTFLPKYSLQHVFPESVKRARLCTELLIKMSSEYSESVDMSDFFLNETQAQLQLSLFGVDSEFERKYNQKIRNAFKMNAEPGFLRELVFN